MRTPLLWNHCICTDLALCNELWHSHFCLPSVRLNERLIQCQVCCSLFLTGRRKTFRRRERENRHCINRKNDSFPMPHSTSTLRRDYILLLLHFFFYNPIITRNISNQYLRGFDCTSRQGHSAFAIRTPVNALSVSCFH